jgi:hypothetical protein
VQNFLQIWPQLAHSQAWNNGGEGGGSTPPSGGGGLELKLGAFLTRPSITDQLFSVPNQPEAFCKVAGFN